MINDNPSDLLGSMAINFQLFITILLHRPRDEHLKLIANYLLVSGEFLEFVSLYQSQDSIIVETGYKWFAPIWKLLGQVKYLEATWEQTDAPYGNFPYSRTQEIRINGQI
jgi:hypothetical protein